VNELSITQEERNHNEETESGDNPMEILYNNFLTIFAGAAISGLRSIGVN
jgi:hypothetical protein